MSAPTHLPTSARDPGGAPDSACQGWYEAHSRAVRARRVAARMMRVAPIASLVLWAAVAVPRGLRAQVPDSTHRDSAAVTLKEIEVVGSIAPTAGPAIGSGIPARISTVTGEAIEAWEPRLLADALATQPGISLYDDLGSAYKLNLSTRGFNVGPVVGLPPGVSVFLDGVRQNEPDAAEVNFDLLPMEHVRRVELLSGSGSLLGANSLGGAINLITRRGTGPLEGELELSGGSYGAASAEGSLSGLTAGKTDYYLAGGYEREDGWRKATAVSTGESPYRPSAPSRKPRRQARCRKASSTFRPGPTSPPATSRISICCRAPCPDTHLSRRDSALSRLMCDGHTPSGSTSTRHRTTTCAP
jgi:outer membrane receptor protein involved in Fe transport